MSRLGLIHLFKFKERLAGVSSIEFRPLKEDEDFSKPIEVELPTMDVKKNAKVRVQFCGFDKETNRIKLKIRTSIFELRKEGSYEGIADFLLFFNELVDFPITKEVFLTPYFYGSEFYRINFSENEEYIKQEAVNYPLQKKLEEELKEELERESEEGDE